MITRYFCLLLLATVIPVAGAQVAAPSGSPAQGRFRILIENTYEGHLDFGPLGKGQRIGKDRVSGELELQNGKYVGEVTASVNSTQTLIGLIGNCNQGHYEDSQKLIVVGTEVDDFNSNVQSVTYDRAARTGSASNKYLLLKFTPKSAIPLPTQRSDGGDWVMGCHSLIERSIQSPNGSWQVVTFLPLNDSRWTSEHDHVGYIIRLPTTGLLKYTDTAVAPGTQPTLALVFTADESVFKVEVEHLQ